MKSVLFITNICTPTPSSNAACIMRVAEELRRQNVKVTILSIFDRNFDHNCNADLYSLENKKTRVRIIDKIFGCVQDRHLVEEIVKAAIELDKNLHFDFVLGSYRPIESVLAGMEIAQKLNICGASCFFDLPIIHGLQIWKNFMFDRNYRRLYKRIIDNNKLISLKYYETFFSSRLASGELKRIEYTGIPNLRMVRNPEKTTITAKEGVTIVYAGSFSKRIRNPKLMFEYLRPIIGTNIVLHLYSWGCEEIVDEYKTVYRNNLVCHGKMPYDIAQKAIATADVLLNLSNDDENQVPGKIMEYFAMGKAVLNFRFRDDDAGICEYRKYPLLCDVNLCAEENINIVNTIRSFAARSVSTEEIRKLYFDSTPEHFAYLIKKTYESYKEHSNE